MPVIEDKNETEDDDMDQDTPDSDKSDDDDSESGSGSDEESSGNKGACLQSYCLHLSPKPQLSKLLGLTQKVDIKAHTQFC